MSLAKCGGVLADVVERYAHKGKPLLVVGRISVRKYQDKNGADKWGTDVIVEELTLLPSGARDDASNGGGSMPPCATMTPQEYLAQQPTQARQEPDFPFDFAGASGDVDVPF